MFISNISEFFFMAVLIAKTEKKIIIVENRYFTG